MISVIVPFYNAEEFIFELLSALKSQDYSEPYELIFVDNNSTDGSPKIVESFIAENNVTCRLFYYTEKPSSYGARNIGVKNALGDIFAFTDADCIPTKSWLTNISKIFSSNNKNKLVISGDVDLKILNENNIWEQFDKIAHMRNDKNIDKANVATANMAVSKEAFNAVGPFQELLSGADYLWSQRAKSLGLTVLFIPEVLVFHPTRKTVTEIKKKLFRIAIGQAQQYRGLKKLNFTRYKYIFTSASPLRVARYTYAILKQVGLIRSIKFALLFQILILEQSWQYLLALKNERKV